ncbi:MAG: decarboxylating 6-phosphogluconate dehydrogenase [Candidatus Wildermuthbacteria bacterium]|nr:decarboxylating 6-phosphogluconate dehydrogenase [Candidatus Wildermuthbacteria bacterium]
MEKQIGFIGLGKMGMPMVKRLKRKGWDVATFDAKVKGTARTIGEFVSVLVPSRIVWIMIPAGKPFDDALRQLAPRLDKGDIVIDGGNSFYKDSMRRAKKLKTKGIHFLDVGVSGGPVSIGLGRFAIMVGGEKRIYEKCKPIFRNLSGTPAGYMGKSGAGHFAKMIHNGIEYGMMQALAEGFTILKKSPFRFSLKDVAKVYNSNSIITSRLVGWIQEGFEKYGEKLKEASGTVAHTGEGEWTVKTAKELKVFAPIIEGAFKFRVQSKKTSSYAGKILSMLRAVFGGHPINPKKKS